MIASATFVWRAGGAETAENADVIVPLWSFTKTLIAALALTLVRDGWLSLDDPLHGEAFSLRDLLLHRAGLADYGALPAYHAAVAAGEDAWPLTHLLAQVAPLHAGVAHGAFCYSNVGYALVRREIETATNSSLDEALRSRVCAPLGITGLQIAERRSDLDAAEMGSAKGYDPRWVYHGLAIGSLRDALLLLSRLLTSDLLPRSLRDAMMAGMPVGDPGIDRPWQEASYGLGVMTGLTRNGLRVVGHTGGGPGSGVAVYCFLQRSGGAAVFISGSRAHEAERESFALGIDV